MHLLFPAVLLAALCCCRGAGRAGVFHGYTEKSTSGDGDAGSPKPVPEKTLGACRDQQASCADWAASGECSKNSPFMVSACPVSCKSCTPAELRADDFKGESLLFETKYGEIKITPQWHIAPRTVALVLDLAHQAETVKRQCRFYRAEAVPPPQNISGPPYGLLQGSLAGMLTAPPSEGNAPPTYGYIAMITGTTEFYISLMDHTSWGGAHTVWGKVENMEVVEEIVKQAPYKELKHAEFGTVMRMMTQDVLFTPKIVSAAEANGTVEL